MKILLTALIVLSIIVPAGEAFARKPGYTGYGPSGHGPAWCAGSTIPYCARR